jgi:hypothetical protein
MHQTYREATWDETHFALFYQEYASPLLDYLRMQTRTLKTLRGMYSANREVQR